VALTGFTILLNLDIAAGGIACAGLKRSLERLALACLCIIFYFVNSVAFQPLWVFNNYHCLEHKADLTIDATWRRQRFQHLISAYNELVYVLGLYYRHHHLICCPTNHKC
jgi:hypothetical protein